MKVDIDTYSKSKDFVISWFHSKGMKDIDYTIGTMSPITFVPCIVIAYWLGEETKWDPLCIEAVKRLVDFYGYTEILNKPEGSPI